MLSPTLTCSMIGEYNCSITSSFQNATVYFSDIVDFTDITRAIEPLEIVSLLNAVYNLLDTRIECYDVYKVETIGSVYVVCSGLPVRNGNRHVTEIADMSLDILSAVDEFVFPNLPDKSLQFRIGIHTGELLLLWHI